MSLQADVALGNGQNSGMEVRKRALCFCGGNRAKTADSLFEDEELLGSC